jgi:hypothetical protein
MRMIIKSIKKLFVLGAFFLMFSTVQGNEDACPSHITPDQLQQAIDKTTK